MVSPASIAAELYFPQHPSARALASCFLVSRSYLHVVHPRADCAHTHKHIHMRIDAYTYVRAHTTTRTHPLTRPLCASLSCAFGNDPHTTLESTCEHANHTCAHACIQSHNVMILGRIDFQPPFLPNLPIFPKPHGHMQFDAGFSSDATFTTLHTHTHTHKHANTHICMHVSTGVC